MENLSLDAKYEVYKNMSGRELLNLCNTSKFMRETCQKNNFNMIWQHKIKEDFNVDYHDRDGYLEYLRLSYMYSKRLWTVIHYLDSPDFSAREISSKIFDSRNKAFNYVYDYLISNLDVKGGYSQYKKMWEEGWYNPPGEDDQIDIRVYGNVFSIYPIKLDPGRTWTKIDYQEEYEKSLKRLAYEVYEGNDKEEFKKTMENMAYDLSKDKPVDIDKFCKGNEITDCITIKNWLKENSAPFEEADNY